MVFDVPTTKPDTFESGDASTASEFLIDLLIMLPHNDTASTTEFSTSNCRKVVTTPAEDAWIIPAWLQCKYGKNTHY